MKISEQLKKILEEGEQLARYYRHPYITTDHIAYLLVKRVEVIRQVLGDFLQVEWLEQGLKSYLLKRLEQLPEPVNPVETPSLKRALRKMWEIAEWEKEHLNWDLEVEVRGEHLFLAILEEENNFTTRLVKRLLGEKAKDWEKTKMAWSVHFAQEFAADEEEKEEGGLPLTELVSIADRFDEVIGREREIERIIQVLARRKKNNPVLVGEAGVGKSAIVEGLAKRIKRGEVPEFLKGKKIFSLNVGGLIAGTKYRGEFEEKLKAVLKKVKEHPGSILFIDEIHTIIGAGATDKSSLDIANFLKPGLASGEIRVIGATTYDEFKQIEKDKTLHRRFQKIEVREPSIEESVKILRGLRPKYEKFHQIRYSDESLRSAAQLAKKFLTERHLPDSAIDVIDEAGARFKLKGKKLITKKDIEEVVSSMANLPKEVATKDEVSLLKGLEERLKRQVVQQEEAIEAVVRVIKRHKAGLTRDSKPIGSFLFVGPTGVGKTELAKQLAKELGIGFIRFDMSEYQEKHSVAKLIGAPPGYVGYERGGLLVESVRKKPYSVLLLDEIEKAHPDIVQILLQVMDNATLTDNDGRTADFRNVILIMTSNLGVGEGEKIGFGQESTQFKEEAIERFFAPEFLNRLDGVIKFKPLSQRAMVQIVDKFLREVAQKLAARKVELVVSPSAKLELAKRGYSPKFGARPLSRVIEQQIVEPITDQLLFGELQKGGRVEVDFADDQFQFKFTHSHSTPSRPRSEPVS